MVAFDSDEKLEFGGKWKDKVSSRIKTYLSRRTHTGDEAKYEKYNV